MAGVTDWPAKWRTLKLLTNQEMRMAVCRAIQPGVSTAVADSSRKWDVRRPTTPDNLAFFDAMHGFLECASGSGATLIDCDHSEFVQLMSERMQRRLSRERRSISRASFNVDLVSHRGGRTEEWLREGAVDQRFMYAGPESAERWNAVIECGDYDSYEHCKSALKRFIDSEPWQARIKQGSIGNLVILGAGAPDKDLMLLNSMLRAGSYTPSNKLRLIVFDDSFFMLSDTIDKIHQRLKNKGAEDTVEVIPCCADFMNLRLWSDCVGRVDGSRSTAFFILGGTLGNVQEEKLVDAIRAVSEEEDLLIIAGEFMDPDMTPEFHDSLMRAYDNDKARALTLGPVASLFEEEGLGTDKSDCCRHIKFSIEDATLLPARVRTSIRGTVAAVFRPDRPLRGTELVLCVSKRYPIGGLIKMVSRHHFVHVGSSECADWNYYKLLTFCRKDEVEDILGAAADKSVVPASISS